MRITSLEQSILETISLFGAMSLPATPLEIFQNLVNCGMADKCGAEFLQRGIFDQLDYFQFLNVLENSEEIKSKTVKFNGMYQLKADGGGNASHLYDSRQRKYRAAIKKWIILRRFVPFFKIVPFAKIVFAGGSITRNNTSENSDIDILIAAENGRIWIVRAFFVSMAKLFGNYRSADNTKDRFCFNHFISNKNLEIKHQSIYTAELYSRLTPISSSLEKKQEKNALDDFRQKNLWIKNYFPLSFSPAPETFRKYKSFVFFGAIRKTLEFVLSGFAGDALEGICRTIQKSKIARGAGKPGGRVIFSDDEIELHPDSPEKKIISGLNKRIKKLKIKSLPVCAAEWKDSGLIP